VRKVAKGNRSGVVIKVLQAKKRNGRARGKVQVSLTFSLGKFQKEDNSTKSIRSLANSYEKWKRNKDGPKPTLSAGGKGQRGKEKLAGEGNAELRTQTILLGGGPKTRRLTSYVDRIAAKNAQSDQG